jgi:hypothetical protein
MFSLLQMYFTTCPPTSVSLKLQMNTDIHNYAVYLQACFVPRVT